MILIEVVPYPSPLECRIFIYHIYLQNQTKLKSVSKETSLPNIKAITLLYIPLFSSCMSILFYIETLFLTYQDWIPVSYTHLTLPTICSV